MIRTIYSFILLYATCISSIASTNTLGVVESGEIPFTKVLDEKGNVFTGLGESDWIDKYHFNQKQYGFLREGRSVYFGEGCQEFDLQNKTIRCELPKELHDVFISPDGKKLYGTLAQNKSSASIEFLENHSFIIKQLPKTAFGQRFLDPTGKYSAEDGDIGFAPTQIYKTVHVVNIDTGKRKIYQIRNGAYSFLGFSGDGRYVFTESHAIDLKTGRTLSVNYPTNYDVSMEYIIEPARGYETSSSTEKFTSSLRDIKRNRYIWKNMPDYGKALAFSWNSAYLLTDKGYLISTKTGEIVADTIKESRGARFSPDGKSFVTVDAKAFYVYQLPAETAPLFGSYPGTNFNLNF